ncbi:MAG: hypothetical protein KAU94_04080 [Verrucomicrobia bacterium]|nr:hypothetical protein [Verrucomicrobiota bacterium]
MKRILLLTIFSLAIQSHANKKNEIWIHDSTLCIKANPSWIILAHHPFASASRVDFQLVDNEEAEKVTLESELSITTYDLPDKQAVMAFNKEKLSRPTEEAIVTSYEEWSITSWSRDIEGTTYKTTDARTINKSTKLGIIIRLDWPLFKDNPKGYNQRMNTLLESLISQINKSHPEPKTK